MAVGQGNGAVVEQLRERIRRLQAAPRGYLAALRTGIEAFDGLFPAGGLPLGSAVELWGEVASGRTSLALRAVAAAGEEGRLCAYVDGPGELYPPAAAALGVCLDRLLIVRPQEPRQLAWAAVQLLRSGAFACVVLDLTHTGVRLSPAQGKKLADAAFRGGSLLLLLTPPEVPADGMARLTTRAMGVNGVEVELLRSRQGGAGRRILLSWEALQPTAPPWRYLGSASVSGAAAGGTTDGTATPFVRPKRNLERDGVGLSATRPGRDAKLPSLTAGFRLEEG